MVSYGWLCRVVIQLGRTACLQCQDVGLETCSMPLGERVVFPRKQTLVEYVRDGTDPPLVEMMKDPHIDARPVMDWHERALSFRF